MGVGTGVLYRLRCPADVLGPKAFGRLRCPPDVLGPKAFVPRRPWCSAQRIINIHACRGQAYNCKCTRCAPALPATGGAGSRDGPNKIRPRWADFVHIIRFFVHRGRKIFGLSGRPVPTTHRNNSAINRNLKRLPRPVRTPVVAIRFLCIPAKKTSGRAGGLSLYVTGAYERVIFWQGARDFGLDPVLKGEGYFVYFEAFISRSQFKRSAHWRKSLSKKRLLITAGGRRRPEPCPLRCRCTWQSS